MRSPKCAILARIKGTIRRVPSAPEFLRPAPLLLLIRKEGRPGEMVHSTAITVTRMDASTEQRASLMQSKSQLHWYFLLATQNAVHTTGHPDPQTAFMRFRPSWVKDKQRPHKLCESLQAVCSVLTRAVLSQYISLALPSGQ